ncbi:PAS domain-containing protein [Candidatus Saccharibacteria bacterium]|nr:PAS domain-containing protein [Candidatus Saccharibacteria bacterium]
MSLFKRDKTSTSDNGGQANLARLALNSIHDGVMITDKSGVVKFINPAAIAMTECGSFENATGLSYNMLIRLQSKEGRELSENENPLVQAMNTNQPLEHFVACLIGVSSGKVIPIALSVTPADDGQGDRVITFRNVTKELAEEGEQAEFISTASHEMRTPVATIDGYLSLALNPQTATIDERARGYLSAAQAASKHLGKLFQDLLDVTKLDDGRIRPHLMPMEMVGAIKQISDAHAMRAAEAKINYRFGSDDPSAFSNARHLEQVVYGFVDPDFLREIMDNLIDNAIKYTPTGGSIYVNVRGDGDRVLINVTDTGIGISSEDIGHIFQKFYRADNSDTREIGGTGLGLYLVKQRVESMGGRVWAESGFGEGSTFFVSLPRITGEEYEKRMIVIRNQQALQAQAAAPAPVQPAPAATPPAPPVAPVSPPVAPPAPTQPQTQPQQNINQNGGTR